jgi:hypothetical protein
LEIPVLKIEAKYYIELREMEYLRKKYEDKNGPPITQINTDYKKKSV